LNQSIQKFKRKEELKLYCIIKRSYGQKKNKCLVYYSVDISFLKDTCLNFEKSLKHNNLFDIYGFDLIS